MADETPVTPTAADDLATWTMPPPAADTIASPADEAPAKRLSPRVKAAGIVGTAVAVGFVGVLVMQGGSSAAPGTNAQRGFGSPPGAQQGFRGGFDRGLQGTVSAVSGSSITVAGTTVKVTSATQVMVNGAQGSMSDVNKGATVFVHTEGTGSSRYAERIFVGGMPQGGPGGPGFGPPPGTGTDSSTNGSTTHT